MIKLKIESKLLRALPAGLSEAELGSVRGDGEADEAAADTVCGQSAEEEGCDAGGGLCGGGAFL